MSKKVINGILIVAVLLLWGMVAYKFFGGGGTTVDEVVHNVPNHTVILPDFKKDTIALKPYTRDPFLGKIKIAKTTPSKKVVNKPIKKAAPEPKPRYVRWPSIEYLGFIQDKKSSDPLIIGTCDKRIFRKHVNDEIKEGIKLVKFYKDSIQLEFDGHTKMVVRKR